MKRISTTTANLLNALNCISSRTLLLTLLLPMAAMFFSGNVYGQISIPNTTAVTENFDAMAASATALLPASWKMSPAGALAPTYAAGGNFTAVNIQASSGTPAGGGRYNWGTTAGTDRALGIQTSGGYASPNSIMAWYKNTNTSTLTSLTIAYDLERYRINTPSAASVTFFYSLDGTTWTAVTAGDIAAAALPTGTSLYDFNPTGTPSSTVAGKISKSGISITGLTLAANGNIYLRWNLNTTGANSQGIGLDNVSVVAGFAAPSFVLKDNALSGFTYVVGAGPSSSQIDSITATNLPSASGTIRISGSTNFEVSLDNSTWGASFYDIPYTGSNLARTRFYIRLKAGLAVNTYGPENVVVSNLTDPGVPVNDPVACSGSVIAYYDALSDVVAVAASEAVTISSTQNANAPLNIGTGTQVWSLNIRDGGAGSPDVDNLPTIVNALTFAQVGNTVTNWSQAIKTISLFDGATLIATGTVTATQVQFTGMTLTVPDNGSKIITVRLSLNCGIGGNNYDGDHFGFSLAVGNFTTASSATSSQKNPAFSAAQSDNTKNIIDVTATKLTFTVQPITVGVNASISPAVIVTATDACGNKDLGFTAAINITSTGTLTNTQSENAISGVATFPAISFSAAGTSLTLTAAATGLTSIVSNPFDVTVTTVLNPGDLMIVGFDTYTAGPAGEDKLSIANLVPLLPGTEFSIANMVYEATAAANVATARWYNGNGTLSNSPPFITIKYVGASNLTKGSVICITISAGGTVTDIAINGVSSMALFTVPVTSSFVQLASDNPDAFFLMQGTFSGDLPEGANLYKTFAGTVFGAIQIRGSFQPFTVAGNAGGSRVSRIYPTLGCISISMPGGTGSSVAYYGYYKSTANGGLHTGSQHDLISSIGNVAANWTTAIAGLGVDDLGTTTTCANTFTVSSNVAYGYWTGTVTSKDWYDCANWDNFSVPDATINVTIDGTALNDCQIDATSTKAAQYGYTKADAKSVTIVGRKLIIENTGATINRLDVAGNFMINAANGLDMNDGTAAQDGLINVKGNWSNNFSNGFDPGQSEINFNGSSTQTITVPDGEIFYNFTNSNTFAGGVVMANNNANITVNNVFSLTNGVLTLNTNTLTLNGTATGAGTITGSNTSNLIIGGTAGGNLGTLSFTAGSRLLNNITLNRTGVSAAATLGSDLSINTLATITSGILNAGVNSFAGAGSLTMTGGELQVGRPGVTSPELAGTYSLTAGVVNFTGTGSQTIRAINYFDLTSSSTGARIMANTGTIGVANSFTKGTNAYTFTGSTVDYNGSVNQTVTGFTSGISAGSTYNNLTLSNAASQKTLGAATDVEGDLALNNSIVLRLGANYLNLRSSSTQTARVAPASNTASVDYSAGAGRFVVERYYPGRRKWRLITAPVTVDATKTLFNSWQAGGASPVGNGTYITGFGESGANGLDVSPQHNYSLKTFNSATSNFDAVSNTNSNLISGILGGAGTPDNFGYFMFVRGDRTAANVNAFNPYGTVTATTLRDTGKIQLQSYDFPGNATVGKYTLIGNPYASPVNFATLARTGIANKFWAWDPGINGVSGVGGYVIVDLALGTTTTVPASQSGVSQTSIIQSSQAFLVETSGASPKLTFTEADKSSFNNLAVFRPAPSPVPSLAVNLYGVNADGATVLADGVLEQFRNDFSNGADYLDALKFGNVNETFSIQNGGNAFMLERRKPVHENDTIFLSLKRLRQMAYQFDLILHEMTGSRLAAFLQDTYLHTSTPVNMDGSTIVDFSVTGDAASAVANRFYIIFKKAPRCKNLKATVIGTDVVVDWIMEDGTGVSRYEVERSLDGETFVSIGTVDNKTNITAYNWLDQYPAPGVYYYRIKATSDYGAAGYSETAKVKIAKTKSQLYVYPNPVSGGVIGLQMNTMPDGIYNTRLLNANGQVVLNKQLVHTKTASAESIAYPADLTAGTYQLEVTGKDKKRTVVSIVITKD